MKSDLPANTKLVLFCFAVYLEDFPDDIEITHQMLMSSSSFSKNTVVKSLFLAVDRGFLLIDDDGEIDITLKVWRDNHALHV